MTTVSIVVPTHGNRLPLLLETIASFKAQDTTLPAELIIVDDGTTDDTEDVICSDSDPRIRYVRNPKPGMSRARNLGLSLTRGIYIGSFDSDDLMYPTYIQSHAERLAMTGVDVAFSNYVSGISPAADRLTTSSLRVVEGTKEEKIRAMLKRSWLTGVFLARSWVWQQCRYDEGLESGHDLDLKVKILEVNANISLIEEPQWFCRYRHHLGTETGTARQAKGISITREKYADYLQD